MCFVLTAIVRGATVGLLTCLTFGPVTVTVVRAGFEKRIGAAIACGLGAALVDVVESQLAYLGVAELLERVPGAIAFLYLAGGLLLVASGLRLTRRKAGAPDVSLAGGFAAFGQGALMTALNPATLLGWIALAGSLFSDLDRPRAMAASAGVGLGVAIWFVAVAWAAIRGSSVLGERARVVTRALDVVLACAGAYLVVRGAHALFSG